MSAGGGAGPLSIPPNICENMPPIEDSRLISEDEVKCLDLRRVGMGEHVGGCGTNPSTANDAQLKISSNGCSRQGGASIAA